MLGGGGVHHLTRSWVSGLGSRARRPNQTSQRRGFGPGCSANLRFPISAAGQPAPEASLNHRTGTLGPNPNLGVGIITDTRILFCRVPSCKNYSIMICTPKHSSSY